MKRLLKRIGRRPLFWRVYLHGAFLLLVVGLATAAAVHTVRTRQPWRDFPSRFGQHLSERYEALEGDPAQLRLELEQYGRLLTVQASMYRMDGSLIASNIDPPFPPRSPEELAHLDAGHLEHRGHAWACPILLRSGGRWAGYVVMGFPFSADDFLLRGLAVFGVVLVALALASVPLVRAILAPLEALTRAARSFGAGDLSVRTGIKRPDEVGELAGAFDDMADRLEHLLRSEKELLANVSHELRTPLARIRFALELAADGDSEEAQRYLREIGTDLTELERLVEDVLTSARLDLITGRVGDGPPPLRRTRIEGEALIDSAATRFKSVHPGHTLRLELMAPLPDLEGDPVLLRRVLDNLLDNACKYGDADHPIVLAAMQAEQRLTIEVRDRGVGVAPEDLPRLFSPFFRADPSRARETGGVGLGLTLARRVVEAHGGYITALSVAGEGTTFRVILPIAA